MSSTRNCSQEVRKIACSKAECYFLPDSITSAANKHHTRQPYHRVILHLMLQRVPQCCYCCCFDKALQVSIDGYSKHVTRSHSSRHRSSVVTLQQAWLWLPVWCLGPQRRQLYACAWKQLVYHSRILHVQPTGKIGL